MDDQTTSTNQPQMDYKPSKQRRRREKPVDRVLVAKLLADGYTKVEVSRQADCHEQTVHDIARATGDRALILSDFLRDRGNKFALLQRQGLNFIEKALISLEKDLEAGELKASEKARSVFHVGQVFGIVYDKERLEKGKSTSISAVLQLFMVQALEKI